MMMSVDQYLAGRATADTPLAAMLRLPAEERRRLGVEHTAREILQQPWTWRQTARLVLREQAEVVRRFLGCGAITDLVLAGAGSSAYAGLALVPLFRQVCGWAADAVPTTDLLLDARGAFLPGQRQPARSLLVSMARSGDSPESTGVVDSVLRELPEVRHLILCCNGQGALAQRYRDRPNVCTLVLPEAANDQSLMMTSSFTSLIVAGQCVAALAAAAERQYEAVVETMCAAGECLLDAAAVAKELAEPVPDRVCLLASRALSGMAREGALKLLESSAGRVATLSETFLGFRHGPMAFANERTILLFFLSSDESSRPYELDLVREARAKRLGRKSVALGPGAENVEADVRLSAPYAAPLPDCYRAPVDVTFPQMLAFFSCLQLGFQPDAPSAAGVIHRVVQGVRVYG